MKKEAAAKGFRVLMLALIACFASIALCGFSAKAADAPPAIADANFGVSYVNVGSNSVSISFDTGFRNVLGEVELCNSDKQALQTVTAYSYASFKCPINNNSVYYYRVRPYYTDNGTNIYGPWSNYKAFSTIIFKLKKASGRAFKVKCPKLPKVVKTVNIMMSTASKSGFKKVASVKSKKTSKKIKKFKGKKFAYYKTYYVKPEAKLKDGVSCENAYTNNFYWSRRYR